MPDISTLREWTDQELAAVLRQWAFNPTTTRTDLLLMGEAVYRWVASHSDPDEAERVPIGASWAYRGGAPAPTRCWNGNHPAHSEPELVEADGGMPGWLCKGGPAPAQVAGTEGWPPIPKPLPPPPEAPALCNYGPEDMPFVNDKEYLC